MGDFNALNGNVFIVVNYKGKVDRMRKTEWFDKYVQYKKSNDAYKARALLDGEMEGIGDNYADQGN